MRKKIAVAVAAGALVLSGVALAGPALAVTPTPTPSTSETPAAPPGAHATSRVDRVREALAGLVTDGTLTQEQADKVATTLGSADIGGGRHGGGPGGKGGLDAAATALGITPEELRTALQGDTTLAQVAQDQGVPVETLVGALVEAEKTRLAQAVTDGRLTQAEADERLAAVEARVTERVNTAHAERGEGRGGN